MQTLIHPKAALSFLFLMSLFVLKAAAQPADAQYPIIPYPAQLTPAPGHFIITPATAIVLPAGTSFRNEANALEVLLAHCFGKPLANGTPASKKAIRLIDDGSIEAEEGYRLIISPMEMTVTARTPAGMFMAVQTIRQLLPAQAERPGHGRLSEIGSWTAVKNRITRCQYRGCTRLVMAGHAPGCLASFLFYRLPQKVYRRDGPLQDEQAASAFDR